MTYRRILVCVDNSDCSSWAVSHAALIARANQSVLVGVHVGASRLHDQRFKEMEPGLPEKYRQEEKLQESRKKHDTLIEEGLRLISESILDAAQKMAGEPAWESKTLDGRNYVELVKEIEEGYDLVLLGAHGIGLASSKDEVPEAELGSVCERVLRQTDVDLLIAKQAGSLSGRIVVCIDGSPESYDALRKALTLALAIDGSVEAVSAFDPDFHPAAFNSISGVLSEKSAEVFRFEEQKELHDNIVDKGLEFIYQSYLKGAEAVAAGKGCEIKTTLLTGKPAYAILRYLRNRPSALTVVGRHGLHRTSSQDIGFTAETIARHASGNVLVASGRLEFAALDWTKEALERLSNVPEFMRAIVKKAVESHARAQGLREVSAKVVEDAKGGHGVPLPGHGKRPSE